MNTITADQPIFIRDIAHGGHVHARLTPLRLSLPFSLPIHQTPAIRDAVPTSASFRAGTADL
eukprot:221561-Hanusia_phi.AAC.5